MRIDLTVRYKCGCEECIRTVIGIPHELASAPRSKANDRKIADYIKENYHINWLMDTSPLVYVSLCKREHLFTKGEQNMYTLESIRKVIHSYCNLRKVYDPMDVEDIKLSISDGNRKIGRVMNVLCVPDTTMPLM